jgi:hypothetical protein
MKTALAVGCSMTKGHGLPDTINNPRLWVNQLLRSVDCTVITNLSQTGKNNHWIFLETIGALIRQEYDIVIVGWSTIPRFNFNVGLELYSTETMLTNSAMSIHLNNNTVYDSKELVKLGDQLRRIHNDHWDFLDLVKYVNTLIEIQEHTRNGKIFFVNTLGPWPTDYFNKKNILLPSDLSKFEQNLLSVDTRDDAEIFKLYDMIHTQYQTYGGIQESHWLNLYNSIHTLQIDKVSSDDKHPGLLTQDVLFDVMHSRFKATLGIQ